MSRPWRSTGIFDPKMQERFHRRNRFKLWGMIEVVEKFVSRDETIYDIGASHGHLTVKLKQAGFNTLGLDGTPGIEQISEGAVLECDLTTLKRGQVKFRSDWGIFINVGEHVPKQLEKALVEGVASIPITGLMVAWGDKDTPDKMVHNQRPDWYVASVFGLFGWLVNEEMTEEGRKLVGEYGRMDKRLLIMTRSEV